MSKIIIYMSLSKNFLIRESLDSRTDNFKTELIKE
jgi:hypothetical protein